MQTILVKCVKYTFTQIKVGNYYCAQQSAVPGYYHLNGNKTKLYHMFNFITV